ncbi:hydantoinase/oxoprolinase family protein [Salipiger aestuarii]|uniref:hydantoinase/oxoprolinase family protein n=1 Tax=Salipiger aestuarii TaxID=568098 RepID=UPI001CC274BC|nr:hydantoinase/oxoprolinase family protein [Salipiger aestuarii]
MARAIRIISVQRGHDPHNHAPMAFGGAGPLHTVRLARELRILTVIIPRSPGILCAMGLLLSDARADFPATRLTPLNTLRRGFTRAYERMHGFAVAGERILCVTFGVNATGLVQRARLTERHGGGHRQDDVPPWPAEP